VVEGWHAPVYADPVKPASCPGQAYQERHRRQFPQARLLPEVAMKMKLADHSTAMLPLTRTGTAAALVVRAAVIVDALREYFELLWDRATPITAPGPPQQARTSCRLPSGGCWS
jgi:hypothetical protein